LEILTAWQSVVLPLLIGIWIGGLLAAVVWRIGHRNGAVAANVVAAIMGLANVPINILRFYFSISWHGDAYQWFNCLICTAIASAVFWLVLLADVGASAAFMLGLIISCISMVQAYFALPVVLSAFVISWPVWIVAVIGREILRATLPEKYFSQLRFNDPQSRSRNKETGLGHVRKW
jgi:Na+/melibiose symporter-like transporter